MRRLVAPWWTCACSTGCSGARLLTAPPDHRRVAARPPTRPISRGWDRYPTGTRGGNGGGTTLGLGQLFKLLLRLSNVEQLTYPAMFEAAVRVEQDSGTGKMAAWTKFISDVSETPLTDAEKSLIQKIQSETRNPLLQQRELSVDRMDIPITASVVAVKAAVMAMLTIMHDLTDYISAPPASGFNDLDGVDAPWKVLSYLYQKDGPSEAALFAYHAGDLGRCKNFVALSNFINTNASARHARKKTPGGTPPSRRGKNAAWDDPSAVFEAMGTSGLILPLQPGELRPIDQQALWGVINDISALAESAPTVGESARMARKRKAAAIHVDLSLDQVERHNAVMANKASRPREAQDEAAQDEEGEEEADEEDE